jgi:hypothetical protein
VEDAGSILEKRELAAAGIALALTMLVLGLLF